MRSKLIVLSTILGLVFLVTGTVSYFRTVFNGTITAQSGKIVLNVTGFNDEVTKAISLNNDDGYIMPGDSGSFVLTFNATNSNDNIVSYINIERTNLPDNLKFYDSSSYIRQINNYGIYLPIDNQTKELTIYWYWDGTIDNDNDTLFMNQTLTASLTVTSMQGTEDMLYARMKNGSGAFYDELNGYSGINEDNATEFWAYAGEIRSITFSNDLSGLPSTCNDENLCWDISEEGSPEPVYGYMVDSGIDGVIGYDYVLRQDIIGNLNNLFIVSSSTISAPENSVCLFSMNLEEINFNNMFNTSRVTNMTGMFAGCSNLTSLDVSSFNTSNVTDMNGMFDSCSSLTSLDVSSFNTSNVTDMSWMFNWCSNLTSLDVSNFNTSKVTDMYGMFYKCSSLTNLTLDNFDTSNVTEMEGMFCHCSNLNFTDPASPYYIDLDALGPDTSCPK